LNTHIHKPHVSEKDYIGTGLCPGSVERAKLFSAVVGKGKGKMSNDKVQLPKGKIQISNGISEWVAWFH